MAKFKVWYDDQPNEVVDTIDANLAEFGLEIKELEGGDGFNEYEIIKLKHKEL
jgi:hypothetical protein